jgi:hypothetical protein
LRGIPATHRLFAFSVFQQELFRAVAARDSWPGPPASRLMPHTFCFSRRRRLPSAAACCRRGCRLTSKLAFGVDLANFKPRRKQACALPKAALRAARTNNMRHWESRRPACGKNKACGFTKSLPAVPAKARTKRCLESRAVTAIVCFLAFWARKRNPKSSAAPSALIPFASPFPA